MLKKNFFFYENVFFKSFYGNIVCKNIVCDVGLNAFIYRYKSFRCLFRGITLSS